MLHSFLAMRLDLTEQPLIDRPDYEQLKVRGQFNKWEQEAESMHLNGFCMLKDQSPEHHTNIKNVIHDLEPMLNKHLTEWEAGRVGAPRIQDAWKEFESVRRLAVQPSILSLLETIYGRKPFAFQTLNFAVGSQQSYHSDAVHFNSYPLGFMCGVWFALQTVEFDSGPLHYFPGSHRLPYLSARSLHLTRNRIEAEDHPQVLFEPHWEEAVSANRLRSEVFLADVGDIFIWHANLLHGGIRVNRPKLRRWSQVVHYFFDGCLYTTPMFSFSHAQGGTFLRNPLDIKTGKERYAPSYWKELGVEFQKA